MNGDGRRPARTLLINLERDCKKGNKEKRRLAIVNKHKEIPSFTMMISKAALLVLLCGFLNSAAAQVCLDTGTNRTACADAGGECVIDCNATLNVCNVALCEGGDEGGDFGNETVPDEDCACELPLPNDLYCVAVAEGDVCGDNNGTCVQDCNTTENACIAELCDPVSFAPTGTACTCELPLGTVLDQCVEASGSGCDDAGGKCVETADCNTATHTCGNATLCGAAFYASGTPTCVCEIGLQCIEANATGCEDEGGECVAKADCDDEFYKCNVDLCVSGNDGADGDCVCKIARELCKDNIFRFILDFFLGWFYKYILGINLCPGGWFW